MCETHSSDLTGVCVCVCVCVSVCVSVYGILSSAGAGVPARRVLKEKKSATGPAVPVCATGYLWVCLFIHGFLSDPSAPVLSVECCARARPDGGLVTSEMTCVCVCV